jgi:hypothetical protein
MDQQKEDRIRQRAYRLWEENGSPEGQADEYWRRAEAQIDAEGDAEPPPPAVEQSGKRRIAGESLQEGEQVPPGERARGVRRR